MKLKDLWYEVYYYGYFNKPFELYVRAYRNVAINGLNLVEFLKFAYNAGQKQFEIDNSNDIFTKNTDNIFENYNVANCEISLGQVGRIRFDIVCLIIVGLIILLFVVFVLLQNSWCRQ